MITTVAGTDAIFAGENIPPLQAPLSGSLGFGLGLDAQGNLVIADGGNHAVYRVGRDGLLSTIAGTGVPSYSGDGGPARSASLLTPQAIVRDSQGNLYVAEAGNNDIRRISADGIISTFAGNGVQAYGGDGGPATAASISFPETLAIDAAGNVYVGSVTDSRVRKITPSGVISTVAGNGQQDYSGDGGQATKAALNYPEGLAVDAAGNLYIADTLNYRIRKVTPTGVITTVAGGGFGLSLEPLAAGEAAIIPTALAFDNYGTLYFADLLMRRIAKITPEGTIVTVAGIGVEGGAGDGGPALQASLTWPSSLVFDSQGNLYIADTGIGTVRVIRPDGSISRFAGNGAAQYGGDNGPAIFAKMNLPGSIALDSSRNLYIADSFNNRLRKVDPNGVITTVAGTGRAASQGDGDRADRADLHFPSGVAVDKDGSIYVAEQIPGFIRKIRPDGIIQRVAGTGLGNFSGDNGPAIRAGLSTPTALEVDAAGNLYVADAGNNRVRRVDPYGVITTVAGGGTALGDGGPATNAQLKLKLADSPGSGGGLAIDAQGNLYISDTYNHRVRKVTPAGIISTVAGTGKPGFSGDNGPAVNATLNVPQGLAFDNDGNLLIADQDNHRIRKMSPSGLLTTIAGTGRRDFKGDGGPATDAALRSPSDLAVDRQGNILIADEYNNRIRSILAAPPAFDVSSGSLRFSAKSGGPVTQPELLTINSTIPGVQFTVSVSTSGGGNWLRVNPSSGATPRLIEISADPAQVAAGTYTGLITITAPTATPRTRTVSVSLDVTPGPPPELNVDRLNFSFTFANGSSARSDVMNVLNTGGGVLDFTTSARTLTGGDWLKISTTAGKATPSTPAVLGVSTDPTGLEAGSYRGEIEITGAGETETIAVNMTVSTFEKGLLLTQSGLSFTAVENGGAVPPQTFGILNIGKGLINWTVSSSTLSGGDWLSLSQTSGQTDSSLSVPVVEVRVNPAGLAPGTYYGLVRVDYGTERTDNPDAANSPQVMTVFLEVLPRGSDPGALIQPGELVFTAVSGGDFPAAQEILLYNVSSSPKSFRSVISDGQDNFSLSAPPRDGTVLPGQPTRIVVQPRVDNLATSGDRPTLTLEPRVYSRELAFQFSDGRVRTVPVRLIVAPRGTTSTTNSKGRRFAAGCTPTQLVPSMTSLGQSFAVSAGWPVALAAEVRDDCGNPMDDGFVSVSFSNGDPPVLLEPLRQGRWQGSWAARNSARSQVTLRMEATQPQAGIRGTRDVSGDLRSAQDAPTTDKARIVSAASLQPFVPVAPGGRIAILGERLAENNAAAESVPLPTNLAGTEVLMAGRSMPLVSVSQDRLVAVVPSGVNVNTSQQILIRRGVTLSRPTAVDVAPAQPAVFRDGDRPAVLHASGSGSEPAFVTAESPATAGENLLIVSAGLGLTSPRIPDGDAASPDSPAPTTEAVKVTIGGVDAPVSFAGLAPGMPAIYQISLTVPQDVARGDAIPLVVTVAGQISPPVTIPVR